MYETHNQEVFMPTNSQILAIIHDTMQQEITNPVTRAPHALRLTFPDNKQAIIGIILTTAPLHQTAPYELKTAQAHTYHYLHQATKQPFTIRGIEDCRCYIEDICQTMLNAKFRDFEITFPDGSRYLIMVTADN